MTEVTIDVEVSHEVDNGLSAQERHKLLMSDDERFLGLILLWQGSEPMKIDSVSYTHLRAHET